MRVANNDGYEDKKIIGLYDFDKEGREQIHNLKNDKFWEDKYHGEIESGYYRKRNDHSTFYALLIPIPDRLKKFADLEWENFASYVEIENLLPDEFLLSNSFANEKNSPAGKYLKINDSKKSKIWQKLFALKVEQFSDFNALFKKIEDLFNL